MTVGTISELPNLKYPVEGILTVKVPIKPSFPPKGNHIIFEPDLISSISFPLRSNKISPSLQSARGNINRNLQPNDMELCPKCNSDCLKPTEDPRKLICNENGDRLDSSYDLMVTQPRDNSSEMFEWKQS
jgi:hypothetical protein